MHTSGRERKESVMTNFRHEWKHEINPADCMLLKSRLQAVMTPDVHGKNGYYEINVIKLRPSIGLDTQNDIASY